MGKTQYIEVVAANTSGRRCHKCAERIPRGKLFLYMERNRHVYCLCGKCLVIFTALVMKDDPTHKADAAAELI